jgi:hypothetical protein
MLPILRLILLILGLFGFFKTHEGHLGTLDQYFSVCMCSPSCYLPIPCLLFHVMLYNSLKIKIVTGKKSHLHMELTSQLPGAWLLQGAIPEFF